MVRVPQGIERRRQSLRRSLRESFLAGAAIVVPLLITLIVLLFAVDFLTGLLDPAVIVVQQSLLPGDDVPVLAAEVVALLLLVLSILIVGVLAQSDVGHGRIHPRVEARVADLPGIGAIYSSVNDLSTMLLDQDTQSFREVKVVEYPAEGAYTLAFLTAGSSPVVADAVDRSEVVTLFWPMAPNPMGGFLIHVPSDRVHDIDMTVEEGVQTVLSTGVRLEDPPAETPRNGPGSGDADGPGRGARSDVAGGRVDQ